MAAYTSFDCRVQRCLAVQCTYTTRKHCTPIIHSLHRKSFLAFYGFMGVDWGAKRLHLNKSDQFVKQSMDRGGDNKHFHDTDDSTVN